jgi:branched-chain amino acid transport system permease protein
MVYWLQQMLNALQLGSIYALIALGYTMVYGILTMINFAHGDVFMVGAFFCFLAATYLGLPFVPTLLLTMIGAALVGVLLERLAYKPLRNAHPGSRRLLPRWDWDCFWKTSLWPWLPIPNTFLHCWKT